VKNFDSASAHRPGVVQPLAAKGPAAARNPAAPRGAGGTLLYNVLLGKKLRFELKTMRESGVTQESTNKPVWRDEVKPSHEARARRADRPNEPRVGPGEPPSASDSAAAEAVFTELQRCIGFDEQDAGNLRALVPVVAPHLPAIADRFCEEVLRHAGTRKLLAEGPAQVQRLRAALTTWLQSLFGGTYDADYVRDHVRIGRTHVRVGLPQHYVFAAMEVIRRELRRVILEADVPRADSKLDSIQKLLALENAVISESYQDSFLEQVRASERSAIQERLTRAEHLAQIGQLAASLAHEIKNPLAGISGAIQVIRDALEPGAPHRPILAEVLRQINRLDQTVKDLLVYARPVPPRFDQCNLTRVIERLMTVLKREPALQRVRLEHRSDHRPLPSIEADENQIEQLLMNLVLNAADASDSGGLVTLTTRPISTGVQLEIHDHGHGMDEETRRRALEPFFTTKSRGTGLGLPICRRIVEMHGGTLSIRSIVGKETTVSVQLPQRQPSERGSGPPNRPAGRATGADAGGE
jgi:signal transduction histidine kinase